MLLVFGCEERKEEELDVFVDFKNGLLGFDMLGLNKACEDCWLGTFPIKGNPFGKLFATVPCTKVFLGCLGNDT